MFWGLILEPNNRYSQTVNTSFHVSMASMDHESASDSPVQVMLNYEQRTFLLCTLKGSTTWQVPLDLNFEKGSKIAFICNGHARIHLTGYMMPANEFDDDDEDDEDEEEDEVEDEEEVEEEEEIPELITKQAKRKATSSLKDEKKIKCMKRVEYESSEDSNLELVGESEDNEDNDDDDSQDEEEEVVKPQQHKDKTNKQQHKQEQKKKEEKKKLINGKEVKPEQQKKQQKKNKDQQQSQGVQNTQPEQKRRVEEGGVVVEDIKLGNGAFAKAGKFIGVYYVGRLKNGKKFDATSHGDGFKFRLGKGEVIKGWDVGINGMKVGGKRRITIPPSMAYGAKGSPPTIPANSTLVFEVELRNVY